MSRDHARLLRPAQAPAPPPPSVPTVNPPGGEILLHAQQPLAQGLQHRRHRVSSRQVTDLRPCQGSPHLSPRELHTLADRPAPGPSDVLAPQPLPRFAPARAFSPRPNRPAQPQWAAPARTADKGRLFPLSRKGWRLVAVL